MTASFETISWTLDYDGIATLVLDRPDQLNAFSVTMARELTEFFEVHARRDEVRAVLREKLHHLADFMRNQAE